MVIQPCADVAADENVILKTHCYIVTDLSPAIKQKFVRDQLQQDHCDYDNAKQSATTVDDRD